MVKQYPHTIVLSTVASSTQDSDGNWLAGSSSTTDVPGRGEANSKGAMVKDANGTQVVYDWLLFFPLSAPDIAPGTKVQIMDGVKQIGEGTVKRFSRGQLNVRAWI
jgi:hypothetical protein